MIKQYFKRVGVNEEGLTVWELNEEGLHGKAKRLQAVEDSNGCLRVVSHKERTNGGHLRIRRNGKHVYAHRYVWELDNGKEIPNGLVCRHKCDIPDCINPAHLELGTQADNIRDKVKRGRTAKGEKHGRSTITDLDAFLAVITDGTVRQTADIIGCSYVQVSVIRNGKSRPYIKAFCDTRLPNVKIPLEDAKRLNWLFTDIAECANG